MSTPTRIDKIEDEGKRATAQIALNAITSTAREAIDKWEENGEVSEEEILHSLAIKAIAALALIAAESG